MSKKQGCKQLLIQTFWVTENKCTRYAQKPKNQDQTHTFIVLLHTMKRRYNYHFLSNFYCAQGTLWQAVSGHNQKLKYPSR